MAATVAVLAAVALAGCGGHGAGAGTGGRLRIATTVAPITSIVAGVAGDRADVTGIVPEGADSHTFEPRPSVAELLSTADVVFLNGLSLEEPVRRLAESSAGDGAEIVELGTRALPEEDYIFDFSFPEEDGRPNPHLWTDPTYARAYAEIAGDTLAARDPDNGAYYRGNVEAFSAAVDRLDAAMRRALATVAPERRKLLTYHDAYAYFARTYGWEVIGAIQVSDFEDPSPREVARLIDQVRASGVPAIFGSEVFPSPVLERIGREAGVSYVDTLRDDDLPGAPGDPEHSWLGLMRANYATITRALGGDPSPLEALDVSLPAPDRAVYPQ
ncbi:MAG TPA: metal ABC transporter substrate-binding protein [Acidimicrobiales bacterium]|nr:metal ABC transporter substrate-binding protein [Acidimicrobiales bacterium]